MLRQRKITITFGNPVLGKDLQDGSEFLSNKHWVIAEVLVVDHQLAKFLISRVPWWLNTKFQILKAFVSQS